MDANGLIHVTFPETWIMIRYHGQGEFNGKWLTCAGGSGCQFTGSHAEAATENGSLVSDSCLRVSHLDTLESCESP